MDKQMEAEKQRVWEGPLPLDAQPEPDPDLPTTSDLPGAQRAHQNEPERIRNKSKKFLV